MLHRFLTDRFSIFRVFEQNLDVQNLVGISLPLMMLT